MADELKRQLREATDQWLQNASPLLHGAGRTLPQVTVRYDLRGRSAGQVRRQPDGSLAIRYNLAIAQLQPAEFLEKTVPHEVAHVVTWLLHGDRARPHGTEWRNVMAYFGQRAAARCHDFRVPDATPRRQRRWVYRCNCREHALSTTRHHRVQQGQIYLCRLCNGPLRPKSADR